MDDSNARPVRRPDAPRIVEILSPLPPEWSGWQVNGKYLISPDGDRLTPRRVAGLAWRDAMELRRAGFASRRAAEAGRRAAQYGAKVKVVIVDLSDYRCRGIAAS